MNIRIKHKLHLEPLGLLSLAATILLGTTASAAVHGHDDHEPHTAAPTARSLEGDLEQRTQQSIQALNRRLSDTPGDRGVLAKRAALELKLARMRGEHEDYRRAEASFRELLANKETPDASIGLAYALTGQHRFRTALGHARRAAESFPEAPEVRAVLGDLHFALGNYAEAQMAYEALVNDKLTLQSLARMAQIQQQRGRFDEARASYADALRAGELLEDSRSARAWCQTMIGDLARERGDLDAAEAAYRAGLELNPASHASSFRLARVERLRGNLDAARLLLEPLVRDYPRPHYWIELGNLYEELGQADPAATFFDLAEDDMRLDLASGDIGHLRELAEFLLARGGHSDEAAALARRDLAEVRQDSGAYDTLAWALLAAGDKPGALANVREALRPGASSVRLLCRAAQIFEANGLHADAAGHLGLAAETNPALARLALDSSELSELVGLEL